MQQYAAFFTEKLLWNFPLYIFGRLLELYADPEQGLIPVPDANQEDCVRKLAATSVFVHLSNKAQSDQIHLQVRYL